MGLRVTSEEVQEVLATELESTVIDTLIASASAWVDTHLVPKSLPATTLAAVEKYLAAHLCVVTEEGADGQMTKSQRADVAESYAERKGGTATPHLQTAAALDPTGLVRQHWLSGKRVLFHVGAGYDER